MDKRIHNIGLFTAIFGILLIVVTPVICEIDCCCDDDQGTCTISCDSMCCAVAVCAEPFDGMHKLDASRHEPHASASSLPQGALSLPERPPIAAC